MAVFDLDFKRLKADLRTGAEDLRTLKYDIKEAGKGTKDQHQAFRQLAHHHTQLCTLMALSRGKAHAFTGPDNCCSAIHWTSKQFKETYHRQMASVKDLLAAYTVDKPKVGLRLVTSEGTHGQVGDRSEG